MCMTNKQFMRQSTLLTMVMLLTQTYVARADEDRKRYRREVEAYQQTSEYQEFVQKNKQQGE